MKQKILKITQTAVMLALLIVLQAVTKPLGQLVTGSCVNAVLAVTALVAGVGPAVIIALLSPVLAFLLGIAPQILTVPAIMVGNTVFVIALRAIGGPAGADYLRKAAAWVVAALLKFGVLWLLVSKLICGVLAQGLLEQGLLKPPMLQALPATFSWPQLITALIGGGVALLISPIIRKAIKH